MAGSTTPSASEMATEASIALPPARKTSRPTDVACGWLVATAPLSPIISGRFDFTIWALLFSASLNYLSFFQSNLDEFSLVSVKSNPKTPAIHANT
jgi:hypothetical protein